MMVFDRQLVKLRTSVARCGDGNINDDGNSNCMCNDNRNNECQHRNVDGDVDTNTNTNREGNIDGTYRFVEQSGQKVQAIVCCCDGDLSSSNRDGKVRPVDQIDCRHDNSSSNSNINSDSGDGRGN